MENATENPGSLIIELLRDCMRVFYPNGVDDPPVGEFLASSVLAWKLGEMPGRPWATISDSRGPISARHLASLLARVDIAPVRIWRDGEQVRGYERDPLTWKCFSYLPTEEMPKSFRDMVGLPPREAEHDDTPIVPNYGLTFGEK